MKEATLKKRYEDALWYMVQCAAVFQVHCDDEAQNELEMAMAEAWELREKWLAAITINGTGDERQQNEQATERS